MPSCLDALQYIIIIVAIVVHVFIWFIVVERMLLFLFIGILHVFMRIVIDIHRNHRYLLLTMSAFTLYHGRSSASAHKLDFSRICGHGGNRLVSTFLRLVLFAFLSCVFLVFPFLVAMITVLLTRMDAHNRTTNNGCSHRQRNDDQQQSQAELLAMLAVVISVCIIGLTQHCAIGHYLVHEGRGGWRRRFVVHQRIHFVLQRIQRNRNVHVLLHRIGHGAEHIVEAQCRR
mmetsp:Transcript_53290/g.85096  ORF Transcript_53290/g.85096 Transcript_53290/m.85096 type:complete len:230 (+) Transcript_53290:909-1598(+)